MNALPLCAKSGVLHGMLAGFFFSLWRLATGFPVLAPHEFAWAVLLIALLAIIISLFILVVVERYSPAAVLWPDVVNALLVTLITALIIRPLAMHAFFLLLGLWIGIIVGLLIGLLLCRWCLQRLMPTHA